MESGRPCMEHQANECTEHGLKCPKGGNRSKNRSASIREGHRYDHIGDQRRLQLKKITLTRQKRHAQQAQDLKSDGLLGDEPQTVLQHGKVKTTTTR
jgi:hypothetical protein